MLGICCCCCLFLLKYFLNVNPEILSRTKIITYFSVFYIVHKTIFKKPAGNSYKNKQYWPLGWLINLSF